MNYDNILNRDQKISILNNRISQLVVEGYQNSVGLKTAMKLGDEDQINQIKHILHLIELSIETHKEEIDALEAEAKAEEKSE